MKSSFRTRVFPGFSVSSLSSLMSLHSSSRRHVSSLLRRRRISSSSSSSIVFNWNDRSHFQTHRRSFSTGSLSLHVDQISPAPNNQRILFLHGLLGHGRNLKTFAKKTCQAMVDLHDHPHLHSSGKDVQRGEAFSMDLRGHGKSRLLSESSSSSSSFIGCVKDIEYTLNTHSLSPPSVVIGHSFGGRIALQYAYEQLQKATKPKQVWLLDVVPGQANESVERVVGIVSKLVQPSTSTTTINTTIPATTMFESKQHLVKYLTEEEGLDVPTAQWLASSYSIDTEGKPDFGFDLSVIQDILPEFASQDFDGMLHALLSSGIRVDLVRGGKNTAWDIPTLSRLESIQRQYASTQHFGLHVLPKAGHWVHVDDLQGLVSLISKSNYDTVNDTTDEDSSLVIGY